MTSLRSRLTVALVAVALLAVALVGALAYRSASSSIAQLATRLVGTVAEDRRVAFSNRLRRQQHRLESFLNASDACADAARRRTECVRDLRWLAAAEPFALTAIGDATGARLDLSSSASDSATVPRWPQGVSASRLAHFDLTDPLHPLYALRVRFPGSDAAPRYLYATVADFEIGEFGQADQLGKDGEIFITDPTGRPLTPLRYPMAAGARDMITAPAMRECLAGHDGEMVAPDYHGVNVVHGYRKLPEVGGGCIMAHMSRDEAFFPVVALRRRIALIAVALALLAVIMSALLARNLARPLQQLADSADAFGRTGAAPPPATSEVREIRVLSNAFISMASAVQRRTHDLQEALATRARFYNAMNHELRTPVNAILGYNDLLQKDVLGPLSPSQSMAVARSQRATKHLRDLVNDVLDLARIEAGKTELRIEPIRAAELLDDIVATIGPSAQESESTIETDCAPTDLTFITDPRRVRQILFNLTSNAVKYGAGKPVLLRCAEADAEVHFDVTDCGPGIPPEHQARIFEEYVRLDSDESGTGLGLAIARRLAEALGGEVSVASSGAGGTTFRLVLPVDGPPARSEAAQHAAAT